MKVLNGIRLKRYCGNAHILSSITGHENPSGENDACVCFFFTNLNKLKAQSYICLSFIGMID